MVINDKCFVFLFLYELLFFFLLVIRLCFFGEIIRLCFREYRNEDDFLIIGDEFLDGIFGFGDVEFFLVFF